MFTRRGFIGVSTAAVGSLALRPFGLLPAMAQSASNYRALVCVFLFGGNDSNNTIVPMDDTNYKAVSYTHLDVYKRQVVLRGWTEKGGRQP